MSTTPGSAVPDTIVLIHGLWMTSLSWERWSARYRVRGFRVIARNWPGMDVEISDLRRDPSAVAGIGVTEIVDHYDRIIRQLERPPIIMGHSFGALMTQLLLDRGLGAAGVAIATAPVKGILLLPPSTLKVAFPALRNPSNRHRALPLTLAQFRYAFTNDLNEAESKPIYDRYAVPGPDRVLFQAGLANFAPHAVTAVNVRNDRRAPLLLIAGSQDHIAPPSLVRANHELYRKSAAVTDYREFPGRTHFILGQAGWEDVADYALDWALAHALTRGAPTAAQAELPPSRPAERAELR